MSELKITAVNVNHNITDEKYKSSRNYKFKYLILYIENSQYIIQKLSVYTFNIFLIRETNYVLS